jgi:hypothetical protein
VLSDVRSANENNGCRLKSGDLNDYCVMNPSEPDSTLHDIIPVSEFDRAMWGPCSETLFLTPPKAFVLNSTSRTMNDGSRSQAAILAPPRGSSGKRGQGTQSLSPDIAKGSDRDLHRISDQAANAISESLGYLALPSPTISWSSSCYTVTAFQSDRLSSQMLTPDLCSGNDLASETGTSHDAR